MSDWWRRAECRTADPEAAFAAEGSLEEAMFIGLFCERCPVKRECLEFGLRFDEAGVYGGMNHRQRRWEKRRREKRAGQCGSDTAYHRHLRHGQEPCTPCRAEHSRITAANARRRRAAA